MCADSVHSLRVIIDCLKREDSDCRMLWKPLRPFDILPWEFLQFAREDLLEQSDRGRANALTNSKRAMQCRADEIIALHNLRAFFNRKRMPLPPKLRFLNNLGVSTPDVLRDLITEKRNYLEHEYVRPDKPDEIRYIADIVELFLKASDQYVERGHLASATVTCPIRSTEIETASSKITKTRMETEEYRLDFNYTDDSIVYTYRERHSIKQFDHTRLEIKEWDDFNSDPAITSFSIRDCRQEDMGELITLLLKKNIASGR